MANTREWPAGILCITLPALEEAYVVRRPKTYQNLMTTAAALFRTRFDEAEEMYIKTNDFGLELPVEVLPDAWEMSEVREFLKTVEIHTRIRGEGPSQLDFVNTDNTQTTIPLSPSATPPRDVSGRAIAHSTPANRRTNAKRQPDDELESVGYRGHSEDEDLNEPTAESSGNFRSRMSLQARAFNSDPRPIRTIRMDPTNEEITLPSSQESDFTTDDKLYIEVRYEDQSITIKVRPRRTFASLFKTACNHFKLDKDTIKLFQMVAFDGRESMNPIESNLTATLSEGNVTDNDVFFLLPYDDDD